MSDISSRPTGSSGSAESAGSRSNQLSQIKSKSERENLEETSPIIELGRLKLRGKTDDLPQDWWFASTAIPLIAATIGPLANVLSIAALVSPWRVALPNNGQLPEGTDDAGIDMADPHWIDIVNAVSLVCGFIGNLCLLLNFTKRVRYIVVLPLTIITWYIATALLMTIIVVINTYDAPKRPGETYSQGFWHAIIATVLYLIGSMILMVNMLGYFLGHYPQHFDLDDDQRTLILQTMMFFFWLAGGAAVFSRVCGFTYANALYFCDVTVLTVGFGDIVATNDTARGLVFPYSVIGIIFLGLMINSIRKFTLGMSQDKIIKKHQMKMRVKTYERTVSSEKELRSRLGLPARQNSDPRTSLSRRPSHQRKGSDTTTIMGARRTSLEQYGHFKLRGHQIIFNQHKHISEQNGVNGHHHHHHHHHESSDENGPQERRHLTRNHKLLLLKEERDRFDTMREIQANTSKWKQYYALSMSVFAFGIVWCVGALVFWYAEARLQQLSYFEALYFCYVSLLTIGYGDFSPKSNAGKPFFVIWSLVAIPTMTILISDMGDTVISGINRGTFTLADWTVMPKQGVWRDFLERHQRLKGWLERKVSERQAKNRIEHGFEVQNPDEFDGDRLEAGIEEPLPGEQTTLERLAEETPKTTEHDLARKLAIAIKRVAIDLRAETPKKYDYEEWVEFTRLIRFSHEKAEDVERDEEDDGLVEWDWIGEDSPMLSDVSESEWVLDRLCESLNRYTKKQAREVGEHQIHRNAFTSVTHHTDVSHESTPDREKPRYQHYPAHPGPREPRKRNSMESRSLSPGFSRYRLDQEERPGSQDGTTTKSIC